MSVILSFHFVFKYRCEFFYIKLAISTIIWLKLKPLLQKSNQLRLNLLFIIIISHIILYNLETAKAGVIDQVLELILICLLFRWNTNFIPRIQISQGRQFANLPKSTMLICWWWVLVDLVPFVVPFLEVLVIMFFTTLNVLSLLSPLLSN